jgi:hypothetical protein
MISPEELKSEVDKAIQMGHVEGANHIKGIISANPDVKRSRDHFKPISAYGNHIESLPYDQRMEVKKVFKPDYKTPEEEEAERQAAMADLERKIEDRRRAERERTAPIVAKRNATIAAKRSDILDRLMSGEITKEEALAAL